MCGGFQRWTVAYTGTYRITATGARGGTCPGSSGSRAGYGYAQTADVYLEAGQTFKVLVGQADTSGCRASEGGGGGGRTALLIGGGGSGVAYFNSHDGLDAAGYTWHRDSASSAGTSSCTPWSCNSGSGGGMYSTGTSGASAVVRPFPSAPWGWPGSLWHRRREQRQRLWQRWRRYQLRWWARWR